MRPRAMRLRVLGLGQMGRGMALALARAGHEVLGYDIDPAIRAARRAEGVAVAEAAGDLWSGAEAAFVSLQTPEQVEAALLGPDGPLGRAAPGMVVVDASTSQPQTTRRVAARLEEAGLAMIDAPVSGGPTGAEAGTLTMLIGGDPADIARIAPALDALATRRVHVGPVGAGHVAKLVNNLLCATHLLAAAEAMRLCEASGLDVATAMAGINAGSGRSAATEVNLPRWVLNGAYDSGFSMKLMRKDVALARRLVADLGLSLPLAEQAALLWAQSAATLGDGEDFNRIAAHPLSAERAHAG